MSDNDRTHGELDDLLKAESGLTDWEADFIDSLNDRRNNEPEIVTTFIFTDRQAEVVAEIWDKACG